MYVRVLEYLFIRTINAYMYICLHSHKLNHMHSSILIHMNICNMYTFTNVYYICIHNDQYRFFTGVKTFRVVQNNRPLMDTRPVIDPRNKMNQRNKAKSISMFNFSTSFTNLHHDKF